MPAPTNLRWRKSTHSGGQGGQCVEVAVTPTACHIRDSKNPTAATLTVTPEAWSAFLTNLPPGSRVRRAFAHSSSVHRLNHS